jgi:hypothetical protein
MVFARFGSYLAWLAGHYCGRSACIAGVIWGTPLRREFRCIPWRRGGGAVTGNRPTREWIENFPLRPTDANAAAVMTLPSEL